MKHIYIDYAATTPADKRVVKAAQPYFSEIFGNPSSVHAYGTVARKAVDKARLQAADFFNCSTEEVVFTSGGTESENLAIKGIAFSNRKYGKHIIISSVEHAAVESSASFLEKQGFSVSRIAVNRDCIVDVKAIESSIKEDTTLISVMYVNNEIGSIQPIRQIADMLKLVNAERQSAGRHPVRFHVDGEAASIYLNYDVSVLGVDSVSVNGSKMYSLKGASALYVRKGIGMATQICGGGQESLIRGGTENVPAIVALGEALAIAKTERDSNTANILSIKKELVAVLKENLSGVRINTPAEGAPNILHVTFQGYKAMDIVAMLSDQGIYVSNGSACASNKKEEKSRVMQALGFNGEEMSMSLRFSFGKMNKPSDVGDTVSALKDILVKR
jgi:cysteine desulfurase